MLETIQGGSPRAIIAKEMNCSFEDSKFGNKSRNYAVSN